MIVMYGADPAACHNRHLVHLRDRNIAEIPHDGFGERMLRL